MGTFLRTFNKFLPMKKKLRTQNKLLVTVTPEINYQTIFIQRNKKLYFVKDNTQSAFTC